jgi:uncharacterized protein YyaL (SSP411 family)
MPLRHVRPLILALLPSALALGVSLAPAIAAERYTNRLIESADPYLLEHAHNPVDWYPWGPEAFAKAKAENKPIFLSIGYSTCYWCHVAETTIYSNPTIAAAMNQWFVNVKVDREERPDVDRLYIIATEMLTGNGAWPNNLFLTPDLKPFYAGSYFPPADGPTGPGFPTILTAIHDMWDNHRADRIDPAVATLYDALLKVQHEQASAAAVPLEPAAWMKQAAASMLRSVDPYHGGFGTASSGPKFPQAPGLALLLADDKDPAARAALIGTLDAMAYGGIHDQIGGGLHRYATEPTWSIPHFEKMLADNAQMLRLYAETFALTTDPLDRVMADDIATYLIREMMAPEGGFYIAQDAAVEGAEGADYLWTRDQIETVLGAKETDAFLGAYALTPMPTPQDEAATPSHGAVLRLRLPIAATLERAGVKDIASLLARYAPDRDALLAARQTRKQPLRDDKIVAGLNGMAIGAFARAGVILGEPRYIDVAAKGGTRLWGAYDPTSKRLHHQFFAGNAAVDAYLEDYAMLGGGYLTLADATHDAVWSDRAATLADAMIALFLRPDGRLAGSGEGLLLAMEDTEDTDVPSGASAALDLLARLGSRPDGTRFETAAAAVATHLSGALAKRPQAWPAAVTALVDHPLTDAALAAATAAREPSSPTAAVAATTPRVPSTSDHVHAAAKVDGDTIAVTLSVDPGFHINAHKPSFDYLVPTDLTFAGLKPASIAYPTAMRFKSSFAPDGLDVYEGEVAVVASFPKDALSGVVGISGTITTQACDAQTCLPPATLAVSVAN